MRSSLKKLKIKKRNLKENEVIINLTDTVSIVNIDNERTKYLRIYKKKYAANYLILNKTNLTVKLLSVLSFSKPIMVIN